MKKRISKYDCAIYFCTKMRLGQMFSNFGNKVMNFGLKVGSTLMNVAPKVLRVGGFVTNALSHLPGFIGTAAGWINRGINAANNAISALPNSGFKDKLQSLAEKTSHAVNSGVAKITPAAETAKVIGDQAGAAINAIKQKII